jgi:hypothetical protein
MVETLLEGAAILGLAVVIAGLWYAAWLAWGRIY